MRIIVFRGVYWGPPFLGKVPYHCPKNGESYELWTKFRLVGTNRGDMEGYGATDLRDLLQI